MADETNKSPLGTKEEGKAVSTHTVTRNQKALTPIESLKTTMAGSYLKQIENYYGGDKQQALRFMTAAVEYVRRTPKLLECDKTSLLTSLVQVAQFRFLPSGVSGEAFIIPYSGEAKFQLGYQGIVTLLYRSPKIKGISANIVYENDSFDYQEGLNPHLSHTPTPFGKEKGKAIGVYTVAQLEGNVRTFKVMSEKDVMAIKNLSKAKNSKDSPWNGRDPELWMWKKTCLIQHAKLLPKTDELQQAVAKDYEGSGVDIPNLRADGPATGRAIHTIVEEDNQDENEQGEK